MVSKKTKLEMRDFQLFYGDFQALRNVNIQIPANQITAIIGPSGCGKSTFLRTFNRMNDLISSVHVEGDVFSVLRGYRAQGRRFDVVVLDPPKFAHSERDVRSASRAYKDINLLGFQLLRLGGVLFTFSCSGAVSLDLFQKIVFGAAVDAEREAQIIGCLAQGADHPVALTFPEGAHLKGLICRVG